MSFDWARFFDRYGIEYVDSGPNVKHGELNISCPYCGNDPSHHLGVRSDNGWWACWRGRAQGHAGKSPHRLIMKLIGCTRAEADSIVGQRRLPADALEKALASLTQTSPPRAKPSSLAWPKDIVPLGDKRSCEPGLRYLEQRGYKGEELWRVIDQYGLRYGVAGAFSRRVVLPIVDDVGRGAELVGWTGRSVYASATIRYLSLPDDPEAAARLACAPALLNLRDVVPWSIELEAEGGSVLAVTEGPFDAIRLDSVGRHVGVRATCVFGITASDRQAYVLGCVARSFDRVIIVADRGAQAAAQSTARRLVRLGARVVEVPAGAKDAGDLTREQAARFVVTL